MNLIGGTDPEALRMESRSEIPYSKAVVKEKAVTKPTHTAQIRAMGTDLRGFSASSTRCNEASRPPNRKQVLDRLVRKQIPSPQPV